MKRYVAFLLCTIFLISLVKPIQACDENQTDTYAMQLVFGDSASRYQDNDNAKMLVSALYLCSEQHDEVGSDKLDFLKDEKVRGLPKFKNIKVNNKDLLKCSHGTWEFQPTKISSQKENRKKVLQKTVNNVFDFGFFNNLFKSSEGKCNSFAAYLYYSHILSDYLGDTSDETAVTVKKGYIPAYEGNACININGGKPQFSTAEKNNTEYFVQLSALDNLGRTGVAFANIDKEKLPDINSRQEIGNIKPSGWNQNKYDVVNSNPGYIYNRCHLIAHQLIGVDIHENLITGTRYLNEAMIQWENKVHDYVQETGNHVLYRATPIYKGDNLLASGVQLEAYSVEDKGAGIAFNIYLYNVQPGVELNYSNGENKLSDCLYGESNVLPFAVYNANDNNPDLMYEMRKHLEIIFADQENSKGYDRMIADLSEVEDDARKSLSKTENDRANYIELYKYKYEYYNVLKKYVPKLLKKEKFFKNTFK